MAGLPHRTAPHDPHRTDPHRPAPTRTAPTRTAPTPTAPHRTTRIAAIHEDFSGTRAEPARVAIVGAGPAGFYAAAAVLNAGIGAEVDMYDRLPTPFGLVRTGVAPDHPKIKSVTRVFERIAASTSFRYHGNVEVGLHLTHDELLHHHDAVIYSIGSPNDRRLGIPGEDLLGSHAATDFVAWYNGHPEYNGLSFDLSSRRAIVVGNGNVALDVARMLLLTADELRATDVADHALEALAASGIEEVAILGRRGPLQAAFTNAELRELGELSAADVVVDPAEAELDTLSRAALDAGVDATARRNVEIIGGYAHRPATGKEKLLRLRFLVSPVEILGVDRVEGVRVVRNQLARRDTGELYARATDADEVIDAGLVFRSIGYRGRALPGLPFDERSGTIPNRDGRVIDPATGELIPDVYVAGWIKRGPTGIIGTNKKCAQDTVDLLIEDLGAAPRRREIGGIEALTALLAERQPATVTYGAWEVLDAYERTLGAQRGRPRVKVTDLDEMVRIALSG